MEKTHLVPPLRCLEQDCCLPPLSELVSNYCSSGASVTSLGIVPLISRHFTVKKNSQDAQTTYCEGSLFV